MSTQDRIRPRRPGVCAYARIDEAKVTATGQGSAWLAQETQWFQHAGMLTVTNPCVVGGTVYLHAHSFDRAQELVDLAVRNGVPANCAQVVTQIGNQKPAARAHTDKEAA